MVVKADNAISLPVASKLVAAATEKAREIGQPMNIAVVDDGGHLVAFARMDGAIKASIDISIRKARPSILMNAPTSALMPLAQPGAELYGLEQTRFVPLTSVSVYTALDQGKVTAGDAFSTDAQLSSSKYTMLTDTKHVFGFQNVVPVVSQKLSKDGGPKFAAAVDAVSAKLSLKAMIAMNKAVTIDKKSPETVASAFLTANRLK